MSQKRARTAAEVLAFADDLTNVEKNTNEDVLRIFDDWADVYDEEMAVEGVDYKGPKWLAENVSHLLSDHKDARILDLGAGTGLAGELLGKDGFSNIDALDGSAKMLDKATARDVYKNVIHAIITPKPLHINDSVYDAVISIAAFSANHIPASCFSDLIRITKPGGYCVLGIWDTDMPDFGPEMDRLVSEGKWGIKEKKTDEKIFATFTVHLFTLQTHAGLDSMQN